MDKQHNKVLLQISNLYKRYEDREVLKGVDLSIHKGEVIVILGPSGCGKSTFLRCINGLEKFQEGDINFEDKSFNDKNINWQELHQKIGMVFQNYELFPHMTVMENIMLGPLKVQKRDKKEVEKQAEFHILSQIRLIS